MAENLHALLSAIEAIYDIDMRQKDLHIADHQANMSLVAQAALTPDEFHEPRPGPWQRVHARVVALENAAEALSNLVTKSKNTGPDYEAARLALKKLDATYGGEA